ncbi:MAG: hypothetical protein ACTSPV_10880 [Candidatus Hodarchaeales archaeon]
MTFIESQKSRKLDFYFNNKTPTVITECETSQFRSLPDSLGSLSNLILLEISSNKLSALHKSISQLDQLESFVFSCPNPSILPSISEDITPFTSIKIIGCKPSLLSPFLAHLPKLKTLDLIIHNIEDYPGLEHHPLNLGIKHPMVKDFHGNITTNDPRFSAR